MKKILFILIVTSVFSCQYEIDTFNENPNSPIAVTPSLLLTQTEVATFNIHSGDLSRITALLMQQIAGNDAQYLAYAKYSFTETDMDNSWETIYQNASFTAYDNILKNGSSNPYYAGMSKILLVLNLSKATDLWNDIPFSKAFQGLTGNTQPSYDSQQEVYTKMQNMLTEAISDLSKPASANTKIPTADDLIYEGDTEKWIKAAYTIQARLALRLTNRDGAVTAANKALSYLAAGGMTSNDDDMNAVFFKDKISSYNQWYAFNNARGGYIKMGKYFVDSLESTNDPRLPFFVSKDTKDPASPTGYTGVPANSTDNEASDIGPAINEPDSPLGMVTYAEAKFIEAEARFIISGATAAQPIFKDAVSASLLNYVGSVDMTFVNNVTATVTLENIIQQKYIAMFANPEAYNDYRRTGFPVLVPNSDVAPKLIPQRMPTPGKERRYNPNATVVSDLTAKVWWAK